MSSSHGTALPRTVRTRPGRSVRRYDRCLRSISTTASRSRRRPRAAAGSSALIWSRAGEPGGGAAGALRLDLAYQRAERAERSEGRHAALLALVRHAARRIVGEERLCRAEKLLHERVLRPGAGRLEAIE